METRMEMFKKYLDRTNMEHKEYQYDGVRWCLDNELKVDPPCNVRGGFIADEMGLGKTIMMIGLMYSNFVGHTLVIVPPILIDQWFVQIYKTTGHKALIYHGDNKKSITLEKLSSAPIVISTYGAITLTKKQLKDKSVTMLHRVPFGWNRIVFDEVGKHTKLRHKIFSDFPKWFREIRPFKCWFPKGNSVHPYDWDFRDSKNMKTKYRNKKMREF